MWGFFTIFPSLTAETAFAMWCQAAGKVGGLPDSGGERASVSAWDGDPYLASRDHSAEDAETSGTHLQQSLSSPSPPSPPASSAKDPASHPNCIPVTRGASHNLCTAQGRQKAKPLLKKTAAAPRQPRASHRHGFPIGAISPFLPRESQQSCAAPAVRNIR